MLSKRAWSQQSIVVAITVLMTVAAAVFVRGFLSPSNLIGLLQAVASLGLLGLGMGMIVISRGIDLSMMATLTIPPAFILQMAQQGHSLGLAFAVALAITIALGALNGWLIAYAEMPALFATLATGIFLYGLGSGVFQHETVLWSQSLDGWSWIGRSQVVGIPTPLIIFAATALGFAIFLNCTRVGGFVYAMGDNPASAKVVGIPTRPITILIYVVSALTALTAGCVMAASLEAMPVRIFNSTMIYDVILVVVLGGIGLSGGRGGVSSVLVGTLMIGILTNVMTLLNADYAMQNLVKGALLLAAITLDSRLNPRNEETAQQGDI